MGKALQSSTQCGRKAQKRVSRYVISGPLKLVGIVTSESEVAEADADTPAERNLCVRWNCSEVVLSSIKRHRTNMPSRFPSQGRAGEATSKNALSAQSLVRWRVLDDEHSSLRSMIYPLGPQKLNYCRRIPGFVG